MALLNRVFTQNLDTVAGEIAGTSVDWLRVTLIKKTSGTVYIFTVSGVLPGPGNRLELPLDVPVDIILSPGSKLYAASGAANERVAVVIEPLSFINQILALLAGKRV